MTAHTPLWHTVCCAHHVTCQPYGPLTLYICWTCYDTWTVQ